jgi:hypothetical protein
MEEISSGNQFKIKNLDTGEYYDIDEAAQKFNVMELRFVPLFSSSRLTFHPLPLSLSSFLPLSSFLYLLSPSEEKSFSSDQHSSFQELSDDDEDLYFDAHFEQIKSDLKLSQPPLIRIPLGAKIRFVRISGYQIVADAEKRKFCLFTLEVQCSLAIPSKWKVYRRYSEFRKLSKLLRHEGYYVPVMPPKSVFTSISSDFLSKRSVSSFPSPPLPPLFFLVSSSSPSQKDLEAWLLHFALQHSIDRSAPDPSFNPHLQAFLSHHANYPPYVLPSYGGTTHDDPTSTSSTARDDDHYYDDAKASSSVASLRDEKNSKDLDSKYQDYCNRSKVPSSLLSSVSDVPHPHSPPRSLLTHRLE